jgi:hypothetical protein
MFKVRRWSSRHAAMLNMVYGWWEKLLVALHPLLTRVGYERVERPVYVMEKFIKGFLFDTRMCGSCTLGSTGMTCPMNCPKKMRNGPCGGVRQNGNCEIKPDMPCVWLDAYRGSMQICGGARILEIQEPVDHRISGTSSWLREIRLKVGVG